MKKSLFTFLFVFVLSFVLLSVNSNRAFAEENSVTTLNDTLKDSYQSLSQMEDVTSSDSIETARTSCIGGLSAGDELFSLDDETLKTNGLQKFKIRETYLVVLRSYKDIVLTDLSSLNDSYLYTDTANGKRLFNEKYSQTETAINNAGFMQEVDNAYTEFVNFKNSTTFSTFVTSVSNVSGITATLTTKTSSAIFTTDDVLCISKYESSLKTRNINVALFDNDNLSVEKGGVATLIEIKLKRNGIYQEMSNDFVLNISLTEEVLKELGLSVENGEKYQIVKYLGNQNVSLSALNTISENELSVDFDEFGVYGIVLSGYGLNETNGLLTFAKNYGFYIAVVLVILLILLIIVGSIRRKKRKKQKKLKKDFNEFVNNQKEIEKSKKKVEKEKK